ncbi:hypothetical protein Prudu_004947 [Prunus dulcis]|uniref:Peptide N-acetyl-beta-D-glucosaminyl asparaginase amidase A N-terminal domain-containing protein n=1 Tax=Prunus dulcis TaxID=3755 RepID=A0A4Y1QWI5_PRUDU|nr:hypothetical protein Prudu_004947 [Prunus dulcis]
MASLLPLFFLLLLHQPLFSTANVHKLNLLRSELLSEPTPLHDTPPTVFFEVTKPIEVPKTKPCSQLILQHDFAYTYGQAPVFANYTPPSDCPSQTFSTIVLEWKATCRGRQFDRIFGFGLVGLRFSGAAQQNQGLMGLFGLSRRTSQVQNSNDTELKEFKIPQNAYRAVLEVYVSFHENDEFWYSNLPNEYIAANNLSGTPGNGPFREVVVSLDGEVVGAVWPFTMGRATSFGFNVTNALNVWYIDANLHLWLDKQSTKTEGKLFKHSSLPLVVSLVSDFKGLNGTFLTRTSRSVSSTGWVKSSYGNITTLINVLGKDGNMQIVNQKIIFNDSVHINLPSSYVHSLTSHKTFPLYLYTDFLGQGNGTYLLITNVDLGFIEKKSGLGFSNSSLRNLQSAEGNMVVKNNLVVSGLGSTQQNISSSNYTILYDKVGSKCNKKSLSNLDFVLSRLWPFGARMNFAGLRFT